MATRKCAERAAIDLVVTKAFDLFVVHTSKKAIMNLKHLMDENGGHGRQQLILELERELQKRVMKSDVSTSNIVGVYVALSEVSLFFNLINDVCRKMSAYIKTRRDLVDTIVSIVRDQKEPMAELERDDYTRGYNDEYITMGDDNDENRWYKWKPDPLVSNDDASENVNDRCLLSSVLSIFGGKQRFLHDYEMELATKLLSFGWNQSLHSEVLDTMRKVYAEEETNNCEVMLEDIRKSKELFCKRLGILDPKIISSEYWPDMFDRHKLCENNQIPLYEYMTHALDEVAQSYNKKASRFSLSWLPCTCLSGSIHIELEIMDAEDDSMPSMVAELDVSMAEAQILKLFLEKEQWSLKEMVNFTGTESSALIRIIHGWCEKGIMQCFETSEQEMLVKLFVPSIKDLSIV